MEKNQIPDFPPILTPEVIKAFAENSDALKTLKSVLSSGDEAMALCDGCGSDDCCPPCCCPKFLKFKIIGCHVIIINDNAECVKHWCANLDEESTDE